MIMTDPIADMLTRVRNALRLVTKQWKFLQTKKKLKSLRF